MENHLQTNTAIGHKKSGTKTFGKGSFSEMNIELFMVQKNTSSSVKHSGSSILGWACMGDSGKFSLIFSDDVLMVLAAEWI